MNVYKFDFLYFSLSIPVAGFYSLFSFKMAGISFSGNISIGFSFTNEYGDCITFIIHYQGNIIISEFQINPAWGSYF